MCQNDSMNDRWAATEIINRMKYRSSKYQLNYDIVEFKELTKFISQHEIVISQRFHGLVLAQLCRVPFLGIHHHDKLKNCPPNEGQFFPYYGSYKQGLIDSFESVINLQFTDCLPIERNIFRSLASKVEDILSVGG